MKFIKVDASIRNTKGKGAARRMRKTGRTPAVIYGKGTTTTAIAIDPEQLVKALAGPLRVNTPLDISITDADDKTIDTLAVVQDHQYNPITRALLHVDFLAIKEDMPVTVKVPVESTGRSLGEQLGGVLRMVHRSVPVVCLPKDIPAKLVINVEELNVGVTFHASEMKLDEGIVIDLPENEAIITISAVGSDDEDTEEGAAAPAAAPEATPES